MYVALRGDGNDRRVLRVRPLQHGDRVARAAVPADRDIDPGPEAAALAAANVAEQIILDDARTRQNPDPLLHPDGQPFSLEHLFRGGDTLTGITGVLDQRKRTGASRPSTASSRPRQPATSPSIRGPGRRTWAAT